MPAQPQPGAARSPGFVFKFDNADLYEVVRTFAEVLKISYVIDPRVKGVVNIHTSGTITNEDVYPIFLSILKMNGATVQKMQGSIYMIVPFSEGKKLPVALDEGKRSSSTEDRFVIEIIKPKYIPVTELEKVIKPFLSDEKEVILYSQNNILLVADLLSNIKKVRDLIGLFDTDIFTNMNIRFYPIVNSDVTEVAKELEKIFSSLEIPSKSGRGIGITFTPITRLNSLLVVSSITGIFERVEGWIRELDKPPTEEQKIWVYVYYVQNQKAKDLAEVLKQVYAKGKEVKGKAEEPAKKEPTPTPGQPRTTQPTRPTTPATPTPPAPAASHEEATGAVGDISIVVDETNNALVIRALYRDYRAILETVKKLDLYPKQVLIEVMLAEITLDDSTKFGVEWARFNTSNPPNAQQITIQNQPPTDPFTAALTGGGIRYAIVDLGAKLAAAINAAANDNRLNVISSPHILASNNKEAKIQVGKEQPVLTSTYTTGATTTTDVTTSNVIAGSIEYKDIGIILTVTPRISDSGLIAMEVQVEKTEVANTSLGNLPNIPVFLKRVAKTNLSVLEGQIIVIGGLIEDRKGTNKSGVPFLSRIPILGGLFGVQSYDTGKVELLLVMTPHIITDANQSRSVTEEFRQKVRGLQGEIERREKGMK
jgi:general secretion pathway protein D